MNHELETLRKMIVNEIARLNINEDVGSEDLKLARALLEDKAAFNEVAVRAAVIGWAVGHGLLR